MRSGVGSATVAAPVPSSVGRAQAAQWGESAGVVVVAGLLVLVMTQPAFSGFFFGEDFIYIGQFRQHGNEFWRAVLSPTDNIFFRPVFCALSLIWWHILPLDPWVYHVRNFLFTGLNVFLLHRVLVHLTVHRRARVLAVAFFAVSKVHLVTIGFVNVYDSIISLTLLLLTVLFFLRYSEQRRPADYVVAMAACCLAIFTKDYGLVVVVVVAALVAFVAMRPSEWRRQAGRWVWRLAPLPLMVVGYLGLRFAIVGLPPALDDSREIVARQATLYSPQLDVEVTARKVQVFTSLLGNLSLDDPATVGARGLSTRLAVLVPGVPWVEGGIERAFYVGMLLLAALTLVMGRGAGWSLAFPLVWIGVYFAPTLLTRNLQMYYQYEPLAGAAVLLGICLDRIGPRLIRVWIVTLCIIAVNGLISNYTSLYHWQFVANAAQRAHKALSEAYGRQPLESLTLVTASRPFWEFTLAADGKGPVLPELLGRPGLQVRFIGYDLLPARVSDADALNPVVDIDAGFIERKPLLLEALRPASTRAGVPFNVQPEGQAALAVDAQHAVPGTVIVWDGTPLATSYGSERWLTALVPAELYSRPGRYEVYLRDQALESNRLEFVVDP